MTDYDLPDLPSDDDLGITDEDREFLEEIGDDAPELSDAELAALLGESAGPAAKPAEPAKKPTRAEARAAKKAAKEAKKEEKRRAKAAKAAQAAAAREGAKAESHASGPETSAKPEAAPAAEKPSGAQKPPDGKKARERPPEPATPGARWRGPATLAALILITAVGSSRTGQPAPVAANAPDTEFSSSRAMSALIEIARVPRPAGSPEHTRVREYLVDRLESMGLEPEVQTATAAIQGGGVIRVGTMRNIVARIPGTDPSGAVLMTAHYDSRELSPGAADDGMGVVTILEAVRAVLAGGELSNDLIVLITDGEEVGLLGARAFVDEHPLLADVSVVLSFEMRGSSGPSLMFETNEENGWVVRQFGQFDPAPMANSLFLEVYRRMPNSTDFSVFREAGKQGLNFAAIDNAHVYHQRSDTPQNVSERTLQHHGLHALAAARHFGEVDLGSVNAPNVVYFSVPGLGLVVYPQIVGWALVGALLLLLVGGLFLARRAGASLGRVGAGFAVSMLSLALAFGGARLLLRWLMRFHPEAGSLDAATFHREGWYVLAMVTIAFVAVTGLYNVARRWLLPTELALGAVIVPLLAAIGLTAVTPLAAMNLHWPVLATLFAIVTLSLLRDRANGYVGWLVTLLMAVPVLFVLIPIAEITWLALQLATGAWLVLPFAIAISLCLPALEGLRHPNPWWAPLTGAVVAAGAVGLGIVNARPNAERPAPSTLSYAYEHGTGSAVWLTDPFADSLDTDAIEWAVTRAGGSFDGLRDLSGFAYRSGQIPTAAAPVVSAPPPEVVITRDDIEGSVRRVTLLVRSRIGAEYMAFVYDGRGDTRLISINGHEVADPGDLARAEHWGVPDPAIELRLEMPADEAIGLHVVEHLLRPTELLGEDAFDRPPHLAPDVRALSDRALFRYSVGAFADPRHAITLPGAPPVQTTPPPTAPADTLSGTGAEPIAPADSVGAAPVPTDTLPVDTEQPDSAVADTLPTDTVATDTLPTDTVTAGPVVADTVVPDTTGVLPDTVATTPSIVGPPAGSGIDR